MNTSDSSTDWTPISKKTLARAIRSDDFALAEQMADILMEVHPHDKADAMNSPIALAANLGHAHALQCLLDEGQGQWSFRCIGQCLASSVSAHDDACFSIAKHAMAQSNPTAKELSVALHDALCEASNLGKLALVMELIEMGAPTEPAQTHGAFSPLAIAAEYGHVDCLRALAKAGAVVDYDTGNGWTPIARAIKSGNAAIVRELIALGAHLSPVYSIPHGSETHGENPLVQWADSMSAHHERTDILMALFEAGSPFNLCNPRSQSYSSILFAAAERNALSSTTTHAEPKGIPSSL